MARSTLRSRAAVAVAAASALGPQAGAAVAHDGAAESIATFPASADTYVDESFPSTANGGESVLRVDGLPQRHAYVRFDPLLASGQVRSATLRLHAMRSHPSGLEVRAAGTDWDERTLTWEGRPNLSPEVVGRSGPLTAGQWASIDVSGLVGSDAPVGFALTTGGEESVYVASRERGVELAPQLVLTSGEGDATPPGEGGGSPPPAEPDPLTCAGYPEPRVFLESQSWWYDSRSLSDGQSSHAHAGACFPINRSVSGTLTLDVRSMIHNEPAGTKLEFVRVQAMQRGPGVTTLAVLNPKAPCTSHDCTFWNRIPVDLTSLPRSGVTEFRIHTETERPDGSRQRATGGWLAWVENGAPRSTSTAVRWPTTEGRGWYQRPGQPELGYENAVLRSEVPTAPVCGLWRVKIETKAGSGGQPPTGTRVLVDPNLHAVPEDPGLVVHESTGDGTRELIVDTTLLADGPHKLVIVAKADVNLDERLAGAQVVPFTVDNGLACPPPPAVDPMFAAAPMLSGSPTDTADVFLDAFADGASAIEYWVDGRRVAWDSSPPEFDEYWDVDTVEPGLHELVVRATVGGEVRESAPESFTVAR